MWSYAGSAGDVLEDDPVGRLKVFVYDIPRSVHHCVLKPSSD